MYTKSIPFITSEKMKNNAVIEPANGMSMVIPHECGSPFLTSSCLNI